MTRHSGIACWIALVAVGLSTCRQGPTKGSRVSVSDVDSAAVELSAQAPFDVELIRKLPGPDRPDYWLGSLPRPLRWTHEGQQRLVTHVVLAAGMQGTPLGREPTLVGIAYVTDMTILDDTSLDFRKCVHVAMGTARQR